MGNKNIDDEEVISRGDNSRTQTERGKDERKSKRLRIIGLTLGACLCFLAVIMAVAILDSLVTKIDLMNHSSVLVVTITVSTLATTALGAIVGSSID